MREPLIRLETAGAQRRLRNLTVPRVRLWGADEHGTLVSLCIADDHCDAVLAFDFYIGGRIGYWVADRVWNHGLRKQERRRRVRSVA